MVIKLEPQLLSWLQPRKNNCIPRELDVSISANVVILIRGLQQKYVEVKSLRSSGWISNILLKEKSKFILSVF